MLGEALRQHREWKQVRARLDRGAFHRPKAAKYFIASPPILLPPTPLPPTPSPFSLGIKVVFNLGYFRIQSEREAYQNQPSLLRVEDVIREISLGEHVSKSDILSGRRHQFIVHARFLISYLCWELTNKSLPEIGRRLGHKDHSSVLYGRDRIKQEIADHSPLGIKAAEYRKKLAEKYGVHKSPKRNTRSPLSVSPVSPHGLPPPAAPTAP